MEVPIFHALHAMAYRTICYLSQVAGLNLEALQVRVRIRESEHHEHFEISHYFTR